MTELKSKLYRLNLQFFADGDNQDDNSNTDDDNQDDDNSSDDNTNDNNQDDQTFTKSDVDSAISKAVNTALKNQAAKLEKEKQQAIEDAKKDAAAYSKMTKQQQQDADYQKRMEKLENRERELNLKQLRTEVEGDLKEEGLPPDFAESLVAMDDNEKIKESISHIKKTFDEAVNNAVKEKLRQDPPQGGQSFKERKSAGNKSRAEMAKKARII
ncbi:DUF4355 domain-containing protein [Halobacillus sp. H74]|uniref:DUF4355 domain-containing protein n=1 Tax=Halobacillus sp. H74 TaxID=3457436 RepID=UPI003FCCA1BD